MQPASALSIATPGWPAGLPPALGQRLWRASSLGASSSPVAPSGFAALDAELPGGGWASGQVNEILCPREAALEWRLLGAALRVWLAGPDLPRVPARRPARPALPPKTMLLIGPPHTPFLPGLQALGIAPAQVVWIAADTEPERLWAAEQALRNPATAALIAWLPELRGAQSQQIRRLQSATQGSQALSFLLRPEAARTQASAAPLRALLSPGEGFAIRVQLLKRRGPAHEQALTLPALPPGWERLLSLRVLSGQRPIHPARPRQDTSHALARPAAVTTPSH